MYSILIEFIITSIISAAADAEGGLLRNINPASTGSAWPFFKLRYYQNLSGLNFANNNGDDIISISDLLPENKMKVNNKERIEKLKDK